jgi:hypothetical protein
MQGTLPKFRLCHTLTVLLFVLVSAQTAVQDGMWFKVHENVSRSNIGKYMDDA